MWSRVLVLLFSLALTKTESKRNYKNYRIIRFHANGTDQQDLVRDFIEGNPSDVIIAKEFVNAIDLIVSPDLYGKAFDLSNKLGIWDLLEPDLQVAIEAENLGYGSKHIAQKEKANSEIYLRAMNAFYATKNHERRSFRSPPALLGPMLDFDLKEENSCFGSFDFRSYHRFKAISDFIDCIGQSYPDLAKVIDIGKSTEGRPIKVVKLSKPGTKAGRPSIFIEGGIHAREWISPASVLYILYLYTVRNYQFPDIFNHYDVYILPVLNPDGYEYTHTDDRMWRKTRSKQGRCWGVDPNRNFGYKWGGKGTSGNPCSDIYRGRRPFSEPELKALRDYILPQKENFVLYLAFHSYGQYILYPWGYDKVDAKNVKELQRLGEYGANAARFQYSVGNSAKLLYPAAGASDDWAMGEAGIRFVYTVELPDQGRYNFMLPNSFIRVVGPEALDITSNMIMNLPK